MVVKIRIIIEGDYEFDRSAYKTVLDENDEERETTEEERDALTEAQMLEYEKRFIVNGDYNIDEIIDNMDYDSATDLTIELQ